MYTQLLTSINNLSVYTNPCLSVIYLFFYPQTQEGSREKWERGRAWSEGQQGTGGHQPAGSTPPSPTGSRTPCAAANSRNGHRLITT